MSENYQVMFTGLTQGMQPADAQAKLAAKLNAPNSKVAAFFNNKPLFAPCLKDKALKQAKLLASVGIKSKLQPIDGQEKNSTIAKDTQQQQRDERIFNALDYITSSLIRIEEKLDELEQRLPETPEQLTTNESNDWQDDELLLDDELSTPVKKRSNALLYSLIAMVLMLLVILGLSLALPDLFSFLDA